MAGESSRNGPFGAGAVPYEMAPELAAKLTAPELPLCHVARPRLASAVDLATASPLTIVSAPAGWGKTVLLSSWAHRQAGHTPVAWLTVEPGNRSLFWEYLLAAMRFAAVLDEAGWAATSGLARLPDRLAAWSTEPGEPVVVVVDDFHEVSEAHLLTELASLVNHAGSRLRLVLCCRADPAMPLHRWRLSGAMGEIRAASLSFTLDETTALLAAHDVHISDQALTDLHVVTAGWPASLRLAAQSMRGSPEPERVAAEFANHDQVLADYLLSEVVAGFDEDIRDVLLSTSILDQVTPPLIAALTGRADGARILAELGRANPLVVCLRGAGDWYRYHPLLSQIMRTELKRRSPQRVRELHARAARWYDENGPAADAIRHALAAHEWSRASDLVTQHWPEVVPGMGRRILHDPTPPPAELVRTDLALALAFAADRLDVNDRTGTRAFLRIADRVPPARADDPADRDAMVAAFQLAEAGLGGEIDQMLEAAPRLLALHPESINDRGYQHLQALALIALANAEHDRGHRELAAEPLRRGLSLARDAGLAQLQLAAMRGVTLLETCSGHLRAGDRSAREMLDFAEDRGWHGAADVVWVRLALAEIYYQRGLVDEATFHLDGAVDGAAHAEPSLQTSIAIVRSQLRHAMGDAAGALRILTAARRDLADAVLAPLLDTALALSEAELRTACGDTATARRVLEALGPTAIEPAWRDVVRATIALTEGHPIMAAAVTAGYADAPDPAVPTHTLVAAALLHARATKLTGDHDRSARALELALRLAEGEGIRRPFLAGGRAVADLLSAHLVVGTAYRALASELAAQAGSAALQRGGRTPGLLEPLTDREIAVLRLLPSMLSNEEIAQALFISVNTVKTHMKNIYRKLGAARRRDAVRRASDLQLI